MSDSQIPAGIPALVVRFGQSPRAATLDAGGALALEAEISGAAPKVRFVPSRERRSCQVGGALGLLLFAATLGCATYVPAPIDLVAHENAWPARDPAAPTIRELAARLAAAAPTPRAAFDLADGIDVFEAEAVALVLNADLRAARLRSGIPAAGAPLAGLWEDPTIGVDLERILRSVPEPWVLGSTIAITLPLSGRRGAAEALANSTSRTAVAEMLEQETRLRTAVRRNFAAHAATGLGIVARQAKLAELDRILVVVDRLENSAEMSRTEGRLFRIERATLAASLTSDEAAARRLHLELLALLGLRPEAEISRRDDLAVLRTPLPRPSVTAAPRWHRTTVVAMARYQEAEDTLRLAVARATPDLTLGPGLGGEDGDARGLFSLSLPLPFLNGNRREIAEATAAREAAGAELLAAVERLRHEEAQHELERRRAVDEEGALLGTVVPLVEQELRDLDRLAALGEVAPLLYLEALSRDLETRLSLVDAARRAAEATIDLDALVSFRSVSSAASSPESEPSR